MSDLHQSPDNLVASGDNEAARPHATGQHSSGGFGHTIAMIICCIPMIAIAFLLVATGVVSAGFILVAVACVVMMAIMMRGMDDRHGAG